MRTFTACLFVLALFVENRSQNVFSRVLKLTNGRIFVNSAIPSMDRGYVVVGGSGEKGFMAKIDSAGQFVWHRALDCNSPFVYPQIVLNAVNTTADSCYVVAGTMKDPVRPLMNGLVMKISASGNVLWSKSVATDKSLELFSVEQVADSGYILTGNQRDGAAPYSKVFAAKLDMTGNLIWSSSYSAGNNTNLCNGIKQSSDSTYLMGGFIESCSPCEGFVFLMSISATGNILWTRKYQPNTGNIPLLNDFLILPDGVLLYTGQQQSPALMKTDLSGNVIWSYVYNYQMQSALLSSVSAKIRQTSDGHFIFVDHNCGSSDLMRVDTLGNVKWVKGIRLDALQVFETKDKGFFVMGNGPLCTMRVTGAANSEIGLMKTDSLGNGPNCVDAETFTMATLTMSSSSVIFTTVATGSVSAASVNSGTLSSLSSYSSCFSVADDLSDGYGRGNTLSGSPNPFSSQTTLQAATPLDHAVLTLVNALGEVVRRQEDIHGDSITILRNGLPNGVYFISLRVDDHMIATGKICIVD
jgi:hypothetical protein